MNLNSSFIGIAFETQTQHGDQPSANPAQVHAARILTEMLRNKYRIPQSNCVTHAQVSVNPDNMLVGYHTDWAGNFPFLAIGLNDNYMAPPPSIYAFGFNYDPGICPRHRSSPLARSRSGRRSDANTSRRARHFRIPVPSNSSEEIQGDIGGAQASGQ